MTQSGGKPAFADSRAARVIALLLIIAGIAVIAWHHRDDILPPQEEAAAANPQLFACIGERTAQVDEAISWVQGEFPAAPGRAAC